MFSQLSQTSTVYSPSYNITSRALVCVFVQTQRHCDAFIFYFHTEKNTFRAGTCHLSMLS